MKKIIALSLYLIPLFSFSQFVNAPPVQNGNISGAEYGNVSNSGPWYIAWDNTNMYIGLNATQNYEPAIMYFDFNPTADSLGGVAAGANGSTTGKNDWGTTPNLPFLAKARLYFLTNANGNNYAEVTVNTGTGWSVPTVISSQLNTSGSSQSYNFELYVSWSQLGTGGSRPATFNWLGTESSEAGYIYHQVPLTNYYGNTTTTPTYYYYQSVINTASTNTNALSTNFESFTDYNDTIFNYVSALPTTLYDLTVGKSNTSTGSLIIQTPITVKNNLTINNGTGGDTLVSIVTDKAYYSPGATVVFTMNKILPSTAIIRYRYLDSIVTETNVSGMTWQWVTPATDFTGYMVDVYTIENGVEKIYGSIAVDVSSDWSKFPRYGFLSAYGQLSSSYMDSVMNNLNRLHINGLQFYDWDYEHQQPLAGTVANPAPSWTDIANRPTYQSTVDYYISSAHSHNMKAMSYNLCYGALIDASADGVLPQWYMYTDQNHQDTAVFDLSAPFKSNIYLTDPSNTSWQQYLAGKNQDMYSVYNFDGYHVDQLGNMGTMYNYNGTNINVPVAYNSFLNAMKTDAPSKRLVMNAVNQYGQQGEIATAPVDFLYTEVWTPNDGYSDLATIIQNNYAWSGNTKNCMLAAYMDYNNGSNPGIFNTPGVLMTDAVIFAFGGAHLEMGEHMLCKEYFPNSNLQMKPDLQAAIINYYDFLSGYENLLRDSGSFNTPTIVSADGKTPLNSWPPQTGSVSVIGKTIGNRQVVHLINFANASSLLWRDANGTQNTPNTYLNSSFSLTVSNTVTKLWVASPDINGGVLQSIPFTTVGNTINFTLPSLQYWDMVVVEY